MEEMPRVIQLRETIYSTNILIALCNRLCRDETRYWSYLQWEKIMLIVDPMRPIAASNMDEPVRYFQGFYMCFRSQERVIKGFELVRAHCQRKKDMGRHRIVAGIHIALTSTINWIIQETRSMQFLLVIPRDMPRIMQDEPVFIYMTNALIDDLADEPTEHIFARLRQPFVHY
jgi:hypothetical protein